MRLTALAAAAAVMLAAFPSLALAHPKLLSATPAANSAVAKPTSITLTFSEDLVAPLSGIDLVMTGMPGMADHKPMPIKGIAARAKGKTMTIALPRPLPTGTYELTWHAVAADQHRIEGSYGFTVR
ncbi:copper homeostasis periplasmic binding protein CopC [Novosphingobium aerophilum]|uniref:copper homeostasis periplasmic binding protein CopC n=1 Tax=Novosphingobium TaxID=165696 RepID=UPI0012CEB082|nr:MULTISPECIES: copper homeostasis periplasmic binding protein CopC [unclassified Novosphingobium]MPS68871.1 copper homeostasis periplasmic binding protein CopC [Novosphingobium sp.]WRT96078.1 copper homeostasis periplasmic binding protein CopC [Novosphingobium sp. RL4]